MRLARSQISLPTLAVEAICASDYLACRPGKLDHLGDGLALAKLREVRVTICSQVGDVFILLLSRLGP